MGGKVIHTQTDIADSRLNRSKGHFSENIVFFFPKLGCIKLSTPNVAIPKVFCEHCDLIQCVASIGFISNLTKKELTIFPRNKTSKESCEYQE